MVKAAPEFLALPGRSTRYPDSKAITLSEEGSDTVTLDDNFTTTHLTRQARSFILGGVNAAHFAADFLGLPVGHVDSLRLCCRKSTSDNDFDRKTRIDGCAAIDNLCSRPGPDHPDDDSLSDDNVQAED
jgi:hypothetical protein